MRILPALVLAFAGQTLQVAPTVGPTIETTLPPQVLPAPTPAPQNHYRCKEARGGLIILECMDCGEREPPLVIFACVNCACDSDK